MSTDNGTLPKAMPMWVKSRRCDGGGSCVEVANLGGDVAVRDSKDPASPQLLFTREEWEAFVAGVRCGQFDFFG